MMIQSSNPVSTLPGLEHNGAVQQGGQAEAGNTAAFTSSLMQQLALLQGNPANNTSADASVLTGLLAKEGLTDGNIAGQGVQNFAALFGKNAPTAKKTDQEINLDDTLSALSDVLQYLQSLKTDAATPAQSQPVDDPTSQADNAKDHAADALSPSDQGSDPADLAAAIALTQQIQQDQQARQAAQQNADQAASGAALSASLQQIQPPAPAKSAAGEASIASVLAGKDELQGMKKTPQLGNADNLHLGFAVAQAGNEKQPLALDNGTAGAMSGQDNAPHNAGQDLQMAQDKAGDDPAVSANQTGGIETDKNPSRMAVDIAQLNQAVSTGKTAEAPAMDRHLSHPDWNQELGQKLIWMHKQDVPSAELRLNPQHLGPISIKVDVDQNQQTTVTFTALHAEVKDAIEAAIPKLREMLSGQQLNLADVNVSQQQSEQKQPKDFFQAANSEQGRGNKSGQDGEAETKANSAVVDVADEIDSGRATVSNGLLSLFA